MLLSSSPSKLPSAHRTTSCASSSSCPKLKFYADLSDADACTLLAEDLDVKCAMWKPRLIGYVSSKFPGYKALSAVIANSFNCEWEAPYLVFGRPLMLREMPEFFNFNSTEMSTIPVWVKLPNLPLSCWSENRLSKIASVIGNPIQCDMLTSSMTRLSYARVLVEIDLRKKLRDYVKAGDWCANRGCEGRGWVYQPGAVKGAVGAPTRAVKGSAGVKSDKAIRATTDNAAEIDPLVAAWAVSGVTVGAVSSIANGADIVDSVVVNETEIVGTVVVASVEPTLGGQW
ncbi:hypothetical protein OIU76_026576 [Salix suchowensis]|nr:hypothetical protein OIU76_026576 [Salix suchowensis]